MSWGLTAARPEWLLLLIPALGVALWIWLRSRQRLGGLPARAGAVLRTIGLVALVLALSDPQIWRSSDRLSAVFVVDRSRSVDLSGREVAQRVLTEAGESLPEGDQAGVVVVGENALVESLPREDWRQQGELLVEPGEDGSDLAAGLRLAAGLLPPGDEGRIVLLSDGVPTTGSLDEAVLSLGDHIEVVWFPLDASESNDVLIESVQAPERVTESEPHRIRVAVAATRESEGVLRLFRGNELISASRVRLRAGRDNVFSVERPGPDAVGMLHYRAEIEVAGDSEIENNRASAVVRVDGRPRVLLVDRDPKSMSPAERALNRAGIRTETFTPGGLPAGLTGMAGYDAIMLADAPATDLADRQLADLRAYVDAAGGGLLMLGGPDSLGPGGYWQTPVEEALPVDLDVTDRRHYPSIGLVVCIDKSGSMAGAGTEQKIEVAKAAAAGLTEQLTPQDRIGVIGFDAAAKWVVPITSAGEKEQIVSQLGTLRAGGGTDAYPAMKEALAALQPLNVRVKHVLLLTDGQLSARAHERLAATMAGQGITISTVAIGSDADTFTLNAIARAGGGEFYLATDAARLPRIFLREAFRVSRAWIEEAPFQPVISSRHPVTEGLNPANAPPLEGYVVSTPKAAAQHPWQTPSGDPLLSAWRYGLGASVVFTSDLEGRWARSWLQWSGYAPLVSQLMRWTARGDVDRGRMHVTAVAEDGVLQVSADLFSAAGDFLNGAAPVAVLALPDGNRREVPLTQVGPGRYSAELDAEQTGVYLAAVIERSEGIGDTAVAVKPYSTELRSLEREPAEVERLLAEGRITRGSDVGALFERRGIGSAVRRSLVPWLLALAAMALLGEVATRRLRFGTQRLAARVPEAGTGAATATATATGAIDPSIGVGAMPESGTSAAPETPSTASAPSSSAESHGEPASSGTAEGPPRERLARLRAARKRAQTQWSDTKRTDDGSSD